MAQKILITNKERAGIENAWHYINNTYEGCTADEKTKEGRSTLNLLRNTMRGLISLKKKFKTTAK